MVRIFSKVFLVTAVFSIWLGFHNIQASASCISYFRVTSFVETSASNPDNLSAKPEATGSGTIDPEEQSVLIEKYTRLFVIIILLLSLITVILAFSKLFAQRKTNRILAHQRNILKNTLMEQRISEEKYKALFSQANDAIFLMDHATFIDCNEKTLEMFGCRREEIIGEPPYRFSPSLQPDGKKSKDKAIYLIDQCHRGKPQRFYWMHSKLDGSLFDAEVSLNMISLEGNLFIQAIVRDISEQVRAEKEMIRAREKAEKATESKTFFLAKMSHEIRTMLSGITSSTQLLLNTKVNKHQSELLDIIDISADNLLTIVNEILDLSKIEAGKIDIEDHPFNISKTLEEIINAYLPEAKKRDISLYLSIHHKLPEYISGDELRLKQILVNLLSNALKFTDKGSVKLDVTIASEDEQACTIDFKIIDTGIGIPENKIKDMFAEYSQSDVSISRRFGGTGLGLNIVYKLMKLMNGTIDVQSKLNKGTQFTVHLLFNKTSYTGTKKEKKETDLLKSTEKYKVLLAEDNIINQKITMINLEQLGHDVDLAVNGNEAWKKYQEQEYEIILMDIQMPEMDGIEVTHLIRKYEADHPAKRRTRIIALTANILGQDADYCLSEGMDAYIPKPFRIEDILKKLEPAKPSE
jgi:PAS domain S-box-containing protein